MVFVTFLTLAFSGPAQGREPMVPATAPLEITVPAFHSVTLSCGLKVSFLKDTKMPLASAELLIPGGHITDPEGKEGLSDIVSMLLRNGGAGKRTPEAFDAACDDRAASLGASAEIEDISISLKCLSQDLPDVLELFADMVLRPQFDPKRFETDKADTLDSLNRLEDTPDALTRVIFYRTLMADSPYGHWANPKSVASITSSDVSQFYRAHFGPQGALLTVTGDFDEEKTTAQLNDLFAEWKSRTAASEPQDGKPLGPTIYFYPKDVTQVFVRYGVLGLKRHDPQDIPLQVANYILGGSGFTSRLMHQIRSDRGLAYFVDSVFQPFDAKGIFEVIGGTRPDSVKEYLSVMFQVLKDFEKDGPDERELAEAKQSMVEEFAYNFESSFTLSGYKSSLDFHGYPENYLSEFREKVKTVTKAQAADAAKTILSQKDWVLVVCGPAALEKDLSEFGTVVKVSNVFDPLPAKP